MVTEICPTTPTRSTSVKVSAAFLSRNTGDECGPLKVGELPVEVSGPFLPILIAW